MLTAHCCPDHVGGGKPGSSDHYKGNEVMSRGVG